MGRKLGSAGAGMAPKTAEHESASNAPVSTFSKSITVLLWIWLAILLVVYYFPCLTGQADFFISDTSLFFEPFCHFVGTQLKEGHFPLWNSLLYCGMSQAAVPSPSIFYFPSFFLFLLPFSLGLSVYMIFHQAVFATGSYLLAREHKMSKEAALFAALSAGLMSYFFAMTRNPTLPAVAAWLPMALFLQKKICLGQSIKQALIRVLFAFVVSNLIAAGRPEIFLPCIGIVFAVACFDFFKSVDKGPSIAPPIKNGGSTASAGATSLPDKAAQTDLPHDNDKNDVGPMPCVEPDSQSSQPNTKKIATKTIFWRIFSLACGIAAAAPIIFPAMEWSGLSARAHGLALSDVVPWSADFFDFLSLVLPFPAGDTCELSGKGAILCNMVKSTRSAMPFLTTVYLGPIILSFAFFAFCQRDWRYRYVFLALTLAGCILSAGYHTPVLPFLLNSFPVLSVLRYPVKLMIFPSITLTIAGIVGFNLACKNKVSTPIIVCSFVAWLSLLLLAVLMQSNPSLLLLGSQFARQPVYGPIVHEVNSNLAEAIAHAGLVGTFSCALTYLLKKNKLSTKWFAILIIAVMGADLVMSACLYPYQTKGGFYRSKSKLITYLKQFLSDGTINGASGRILPLYNLRGMFVPDDFNKGDASITSKFHTYFRSLLYYNANLDFGIPQSYGYEASATGIFHDYFNDANEFSTNFISGEHPKAISDLPIYRFCRYTATQYVLTPISMIPGTPLPTFDDRYFDLFGESTGNNSRIYRVISPMPRLYFADRVKLVQSWKEVRSQLCNPDPIAEDSSKAKIAYIRQQDATILGTSGSESSTDAGLATNARVRLDRDDGQRLSAKVQTAKQALLVISDQYYPGWKAEIDGKPVDTLNANMFARAVVVPKGEHTITMNYAPQSVWFGAVTAASSIAVLVLLSLLL